MKKILMTLAMGIIVSGVISAQNQKVVRMHENANIQKELTPEDIAKKQTANMKERLALTADQEKKVYELNLKYAKDQAKSREIIRKERESMAKNFKEKDSLVKNILTPEQARFHTLYKQMQRQNMMSKRGGNGAKGDMKGEMRGNMKGNMNNHMGGNMK